MKTRLEDVSPDHFDWLVDSRSRNQRATLALYKTIDTHDLILSQNVAYQAFAQELTAVAFSLWRAVFLTDLTGDSAAQLVDVKRFLQKLIAHNAILYHNDFEAREWTFEYYLDNATLRLDYIEAAFKIENKSHISDNPKENWTSAQARLDNLIIKLREMLVG